MNHIERQVLLLIGEDPESPDVFKDNAEDLAPIRDSVNDAIQQIVLLTGGYTETFSIPMIANKSFYRLTFKNGYMGWIKDVWLVNQKRRLTQTDHGALDYIDPRWLTMTGTPEYYIPVGHDVIGFHPKPSASSDVVEITSVVIPAKYTTDHARIKVKKTFEWSVINYAVAEYWASRGDAEEATKNMAIFFDNMGIKHGFRFSNRTQQTQTTKTESVSQ